MFSHRRTTRNLNNCLSLFAGLVLLPLIGLGCYKDLGCQFDPDSATEEVLQTVRAHNRAWTELEDADEQARYVHDDIVFISPPYHEATAGKKAYFENYQQWYDHAKVHYFKEVNPEVVFHCDGKYALVTYQIDMSFDFDDQTVDRWQGMDMMALVYEDGRWLIISDVYAKRTDSTQLDQADSL